MELLVKQQNELNITTHRIRLQFRYCICVKRKCLRHYVVHYIISSKSTLEISRHITTHEFVYYHYTREVLKHHIVCISNSVSLYIHKHIFINVFGLVSRDCYFKIVTLQMGTNIPYDIQY